MGPGVHIGQFGMLFSCCESKTELVIEVIRERWLRARPEDLWLLIDDLARMAGWLAFAGRIEILEGSGAGRRQRFYGQWGKKRSEIDQVVTDCEPGRLLAWRRAPGR